MYSYIPKLHHAMITALFCVCLIAFGIKAQGRVILALNIGAFIFGFMTVVILALIILEALNRRVEVITDWMNAFAKLDDEGRAAVAYQFPTLRYRMKSGEVREMFEDTNVPMDMFRLFLRTSNAKYISPERNWTTGEMPRWVWLEIKQWLEDREYIIADSAAGSHSWLWNGEVFHHLKAYWMAGIHLKNIGREAPALTRSGS